MSLQIHEQIINKLAFFLENKKIPNIIFHGPSGSGKRTIVQNFVSNIYENDKELIDAYIMNVNCAHGKGIKFVRDDLKFFAKTHINIRGSGHFKTIILSNADKLTIDAQSALRRCIELFSHTTRFFIIVEDKYKLLKPILSRFCEIFISEPIINGLKTNLHKHALESCFANKLMDFSKNLYEKGYSALDIMNYVESSNLDVLKKYRMLLSFNKVKKEFRNEKLLMVFILNFIFIRSDFDLENISFM